MKSCGKLQIPVTESIKTKHKFHFGYRCPACIALFLWPTLPYQVKKSYCDGVFSGPFGILSGQLMLKYLIPMPTITSLDHSPHGPVNGVQVRPI